MFWLPLLATHASATPAADRARAALPLRADLDEWRLVTERADGDGGATVRFAPTRDGIPIDASAAIVLGPDGAVRRVRADLIPARFGPAAAIDEDRAIAVAAATGLGGDPRARLSWQTIGRALRLVWTVDLWDSASARLAVPRVRVDAASGAILSIGEGAAHAVVPLARVYSGNPARDAGPVEVELPWATTTLDDGQVLVRQCRDLGEVAIYTVDGVDYPVRRCTPTEAATSADGDFRYDPVLAPVDPRLDEDDFAGPQVSWNLHRGLDWFGALGWVAKPPDGVDVLAPLEAWVNYRVYDPTDASTGSDPQHPLTTYRNAYLSPSYDEQPSRVVFGQSDPADFAYDAEVIHHELGHYVVHTEQALLFAPDTKYGPSIEAYALNEGLADYFSSAIHGDGLVGEWAAEGNGQIRDLAGDETCATSLYGESHYDSLPFSTALWSVRETLGADEQAAMDRAIYEGLAEIGIEASFAEAAEVLAERVADAVSAAAGDALAAAFTARAVDDCVPRVDVTPGPEPFRRFAYVPGSYWFSTQGRIPSYLQFRTEIPEGGARLTLRFAQAEGVGYDPYPTPVVPLAVVGRSGAAVRWDITDGYATGSGFNFLVDVWETTADPLGVPEEIGTHTEEDVPLYVLHDSVLAWEVAEAGPYSFQFTNDQPSLALLVDLTLELEPLAADEEPPPVDESGCGCAHGEARWIWAAPLLAMFFRRRRAA